MSELWGFSIHRRAIVLLAAASGILTATASGSLLFTIIAKPSFGAARTGAPQVVTSFLETYFVSSLVALAVGIIIFLPALIVCANYRLGSGLQWAAYLAAGSVCGLIGLGLEALGVVTAFGLLWLIFLVPGMWIGLVAYPVSKLLAGIPGLLLAAGSCLTCLFFLGGVTILLP